MPERTSAHVPVFTEAETFASQAFKDFYIGSYDDASAEGPQRMAAHRHTYYEVMWIAEGRGTHAVDFVEYAFEGPCLFLLHPGHVHQLRRDGPTRGYVLKFNESFFALDQDSGNLLLKYGVFDNILAQPVLPLTPEAGALLDGLLRSMLTEYGQASSLSGIILASYLKVFLLQVYKLKESHQEEFSERPEPRYFTFRQFKRLVEENYRRQHGVAFYADQLALTQRALGEATQRYAGKKPGAVVQERVLLEARRLLYHGRLSVKEVAAALGFDDAAYFTRFFTRHEGVSPVGFRQGALGPPA